MRILWRPKAVRQLQAIERYIERDKPVAARAMQRRVVEAVSALAAQPSMGRPGRVDGTRELVIAGTPYIVAYAVINDEVRILAVFHGAQRWPETL